MTDHQVALELYARDIYPSREKAHAAVNEDPVGCRRLLQYLRAQTRAAA
jgi:hypothetical protein